jgi:glycosyltransferase involved in cell wall biosynthesis
VPVITTPLPLAADLIHSENVGFEVPWDDPSAVVDAILKLRADPELRAQMGANGHRMALREHDWNRLSADFLRVMDGVAGRQDAESLSASFSQARRPAKP